MNAIQKERRARVRRAHFRPTLQTYVVVRPARLTRTTYMEVGTKLTRADLPTWRLRALYDRHTIGAEGDPWTEAALGRTQARFQADLSRQPAAAQESEANPLVRTLQKLRLLLPAMGEDERAEGAIKKLGGGWYEVIKDGQSRNVHGKAKVAELLGVSAETI